MSESWDRSKQVDTAADTVTPLCICRIKRRTNTNDLSANIAVTGTIHQLGQGGCGGEISLISFEGVWLDFAQKSQLDKNASPPEENTSDQHKRAGEEDDFRKGVLGCNFPG
jgi:hypothetical protein